MRVIKSDVIEVITRTVRKRPKHVYYTYGSFPRQIGGVVYVPQKYIGHQVIVIPTTRSLRVHRYLRKVLDKKIIKV